MGPAKVPNAVGPAPGVPPATVVLRRSNKSPPESILASPEGAPCVRAGGYANGHFMPASRWREIRWRSLRGDRHRRFLCGKVRQALSTAAIRINSALGVATCMAHQNPA